MFMINGTAAQVVYDVYQNRQMITSLARYVILI